MHKDNKDNQDLNFWISYADLMAGLLFVFILLVGAIVIRYVYVQQDLHVKAMALGLSENELDDKNKMLSDLRLKFNESVKSLQETELDLTMVKDLLISSEESLTTVTNLLLENKMNLTQVSGLLVDSSDKNSKLKNRVHNLEQNLSKNTNVLFLKDNEIKLLAKKLLEKSMNHQLLVDELNITKTKIKNLTGIRIKVVSKLKDKLGRSIAIDPRSGAIRFSSNILFDKGQYRLKKSSKKELSGILKSYIHTLLYDDEISRYIEQISIQGHTSKEGTYLYNLELSQKRALEVMKFLYKSDRANRDLYSKYLSASGVSYLDPIYDANGFEDKEASRRIEIKFRIKNEKAIKELSKFLER